VRADECVGAAGGCGGVSLTFVNLSGAARNRRGDGRRRADRPPASI